MASWARNFFFFQFFRLCLVGAVLTSSQAILSNIAWGDRENVGSAPQTEDVRELDPKEPHYFSTGPNSRFVFTFSGSEPGVSLQRLESKQGEQEDADREVVESTVVLLGVPTAFPFRQDGETAKLWVREVGAVGSPMSNRDNHGFFVRVDGVYYLVDGRGKTVGVKPKKEVIKTTADSTQVGDDGARGVISFSYDETGEDGEIYLLSTTGSTPSDTYLLLDRPARKGEGFYITSEVVAGGRTLKNSDLSYVLEFWGEVASEEPILNLLTPTVTQSGRSGLAAEVLRSVATNLDTEVRRDERIAAIELDAVAAEEVVAGLLRDDRGSVVVLGETRVGKTTFVKRLVYEVVTNPEHPLARAGYHFFGVSAASIAAGTQFSGDQETIVNAMIELSRHHRIIWVMDEIHGLRGVGTHRRNEQDVFQWLKPAMGDGYFRAIGMTTPREYRDAFAGDAALESRFSEVFLGSRPTDEILRMARSWIISRGKVPLGDSELDLVYRLSEEFVAEGEQPGRMIALLDSIYAGLAARGITDRVPTIEEIYDFASRMYRVTIVQDPVETIANLRAELDSSIIGHSEIKEALIDMATQIYTGWNPPDVPRGMVLFCGQEGLGKTETARAYARGVGAGNFVRIDTTAFGRSSGEVARFKSQIAAALEVSANTVFLFDEVDESEYEIQDALLTAMDSGWIEVVEDASASSRRKRNRRLSVKKATLFFAGNAGRDYLEKLGSQVGFVQGSGEIRAQIVDQDLESALVRDGLQRSFVDRLERVLPFLPLNKEEFAGVVELHTRRLVSGRSGEVEFTAEAIRAFALAMAQEHYREGMSNRHALRIINDRLRTEIARALLGGIRGPITLRHEGDGRISIAPGSGPCNDALGGTNKSSGS